MARLNYEEAAHRVRMTPTLLKWCTKYAPRRDRVKLVFASDGTIDEHELAAFDAHLRADWGDKYVPAGIFAELTREALGRCALCPQTEPLDGAHVSRLNHEAQHYFQHPHNLLLMCKNCHGRYDSMRDPTLGHGVIAHRKSALQSMLLAAIDLEIRAAQEVEKLIAPHRASLASLGAPSFWSGAPGAVAFQQLTALSGSLGAPPAQGGAAPLQALSAALAVQFPLAAAKVTSLINGLGTAAQAWESLDEGPPDPGYCSRGDGSPALVSYAKCSKCGEEDYSMGNEEPTRVADEDGHVVAYFADARGGEYTLSCEECDQSPLDFEFEDLCGYCAHQADKYADD